MPSRNKRTPNVVVRPIIRGAHKPTKAVLATLEELNEHATVDEIAPQLRVYEETKPWKQARRRREWRMSRRNPGRDDGRTYVSARYVCSGEADNFEAHGGYVRDTDHEREGESACRNEDSSDEEGREHRRAQVEVAIRDIAKPAKPRGTEKCYEIVQTVQRVIALEEDEWQWEIASDDSTYVDWYLLGDEFSAPDGAPSYATVLQQRARGA